MNYDSPFSPFRLTTAMERQPRKFFLEPGGRGWILYVKDFLGRVHNQGAVVKSGGTFPRDLSIVVGLVRERNAHRVLDGTVPVFVESGQDSWHVADICNEG